MEDAVSDSNASSSISRAAIPPVGVERMRSMDVALDHHHYLVLEPLHRWLEEVAAPALSGTVIDYGCGGQPYRELFLRYAKRYVGADVAAAQGVELDILFEPGRPLPLPDASADGIASTQVLEHVPDPAAYLKECARLLRTGGVLVITVPMQWRHHEEPFDFRRYTRYGIESALKDAGFRIQQIAPCGGAYSLIGQVLANTLVERRIYRKWIYTIINRVARFLDRRYPDYSDTLNWNCLAIRS